MKKWIAGLVMLLLVAGVTYETSRYESLQDEVIAFMSAGDRNTGAEGFDRDLQIAELEARLSCLEAKQ